MPRKWTGKWFKKNSGKKPNRKNGRGQPKRGGTQTAGGSFPQVRVKFEQTAPDRTSSRTVVDPVPAKGRRRRTGRRRSSY
jgi:hypothetical protein